MALFTKSRMLSFLARRGFATTVRKQEVHPAYLKIKETQKKFQVNNGLSVSNRYVAGNVELGVFQNIPFPPVTPLASRRCRIEITSLNLVF